MAVGYFINQYPAISHTFIRREIMALEALGLRVRRYAIRKGPGLIDSADKGEASLTRYIKDLSPLIALRYIVWTLCRKPLRFVRVVGRAVTMGIGSDRGIIRHLIYAAEAAVLAAWCREDDIEHVHAHFGTNSAAIAMLTALFGDVTYSFTAHGPEEFEKAPGLSLPAKVEGSRFTVCVSSFGRSQLMRICDPHLWKKIELIHCGVSTLLLDAEPVAPPRSPRFVCVGRICAEKAQLLLVAAAHRLKLLGMLCDIVLVGDGPQRSAVEAAIKHAGLQDNIAITGWASGDRVREEITASSALVLPSFSENLPVALMEAMALNRPVISTYVAGIPELVRPGENGWLVPAGDVEALTAAMFDAATSSPERLFAMGASGKRKVAAEHNTALEANKLLDTFNRYGACVRPKSDGELLDAA